MFYHKIPAPRHGRIHISRVESITASILGLKKSKKEANHNAKNNSFLSFFLSFFFIFHFSFFPSFTFSEFSEVSLFFSFAGVIENDAH